jgi:hypothetical protein
MDFCWHECTTVCIQHMVLIILFRWLSVVLDGLDSNPSRGWRNILRISCASSWFLFTQWWNVILWKLFVWWLEIKWNRSNKYCILFVSYIVYKMNKVSKMSMYYWYLLVCVIDWSNKLPEMVIPLTCAQKVCCLKLGKDKQESHVSICIIMGLSFICSFC